MRWLLLLAMGCDDGSRKRVSILWVQFDSGINAKKQAANLCPREGLSSGMHKLRLKRPVRND